MADFLWEFGARLAVPPSGREQSQQSRTLYPGGNPDLQNMCLFHTKVPKGMLFNSVRNQCRNKKSMHFVFQRFHLQNTPATLCMIKIF